MADSVGIDLAEVDRIRRLLERYGERLIKRILGREERQLYEARGDKAVFLAGRFAAKEAVIKALGAYLKRRPPMHRLQVLNDDTGRPHLRLPSELEAQLSGLRIMISISHERKYAIGMAVATETA